MFSKLKRVKTNFRCSLSLQRLENILRIMEEGPAWEEYDHYPPLNYGIPQNNGAHVMRNKSDHIQPASRTEGFRLYRQMKATMRQQKKKAMEVTKKTKTWMKKDQKKPKV